MARAPPLSSAAHDALRFPGINLSPQYVTLYGFRTLDGYWLAHRGEDMIWHTGDLPGLAFMMACLPRKQWAFTIMANSGQGGKPANQILPFKFLDGERLSWATTLEREVERAAEPLRDPERHLYPDATLGDKAIPFTLPLSHYSGVRSFTPPESFQRSKLIYQQKYMHPAYPNMTLTTKPEFNPSLYTEMSNCEEILHIDWGTVYGRLSIDYTHISGEHSVVYVRSSEEAGQQGDFEPIMSKGEFRLDQDGKGERELGLRLDEEMV